MNTVNRLIFLFFFLLQLPQAQVPEVMAQGVERTVSSLPSTGKTLSIQTVQLPESHERFRWDQIVNWTGTGKKRAALIVQWNDGLKPDLMVWGFRWDVHATALSMIRNICRCDPRFYLLTKSYGIYLIGGIGYNFNENIPFKVTLNDVDQTAVEGAFLEDYFYQGSKKVDNEFKGWKCTNPDNHLCTDDYEAEGKRWYYLVQNQDLDNLLVKVAYTFLHNRKPTAQELTSIDLQDLSWVCLWHGTKIENEKLSVDHFVNQFTVAPTVDFTKGVFFLNSNGLGPYTGALDYLNPNGELTYDIYNKKNNELGLFGVNSVFGTIFDGKLIVLSTQRNRLAILDAITLKRIFTFFDDIITPSEQEGWFGFVPKVTTTPRAFVGINPELGYLSTSKGIYTFNLKTYTIDKYITGTDGDTGNMLYTDNYVFAVQRDRVLILRDEVVVKTITGCEFSSVCKSKDGMVWVAAGVALIKIDPATLEQQTFILPHHAKIGSSWDNWNAGSFCASTKKNALYWTNSTTMFSGARDVYCYEIGDGLSLMSPIYSLPAGQVFNGVGIRVHPVTNLLYITSTCAISNFENNRIHVVDASTGRTVNDYEFNSTFWFPVMPIFPEVATPQIQESARVLSHKLPLTASHANENFKQVYRTGDRLFKLPAEAVVEARNMSGALCFKIKAKHSELKIPQKG